MKLTFFGVTIFILLLAIMAVKAKELIPPRNGVELPRPMHDDDAGFKKNQPDQVVQNLEDLVSNADYICWAKVLSVSSQREQYDAEASLVMSRIVLQIFENWKGKLETGVEIRSFGGVLDGTPYFASEFPVFEKGEEVILFLKSFKGGIFPSGHASGKWEVKSGTVGKKKLGVKEIRSWIKTIVK